MLLYSIWPRLFRLSHCGAYFVSRLSSVTKHRLLHILEGGSNGGHKFHIDRQQNFEIVHDGKRERHADTHAHLHEFNFSGR